MKRNALVLAALLVAGSVCAQPRAIAMLGAVHSERTTWCGSEQIELNGFTPGAGIAYDFSPSVMAAVGGWRTSQENWAPITFADWRPLRHKNVSAGLFAGVSGGYCVYENRLGPIAGLTARIDFKKWALHFFAVPEFGSEKNTPSIGMATSWGF